MPLLPLFAHELGASPALVGFVMAASTITGVFLKLPAGALSDLFGRRRLLLAGALVFASMPLFIELGLKLEGVVLADVVQRTDVGVLQPGDGARFALEALAEAGVPRSVARRDLDGDPAVEPGVARPVHLSHAAGAQRRFDDIRTERAANSQCHGRIPAGRHPACNYTTALRDLRDPQVLDLPEHTLTVASTFRPPPTPFMGTRASREGCI